MAVARQKLENNELLLALLACNGVLDLENCLSRLPPLIDPKVVDELAPLVVKKIRVDAREALQLAEATVLIARKVDCEECLALALRAKADALYGAGQNPAAVEHHDQAYEIYAACERWLGGWCGLSPSLQT